MARIRTIKPDFYTDENLAKCSLGAAYMFPGLWVHADDGGYMSYSPFRIGAWIFTGREESGRVTEFIGELQEIGCVFLFEDGGRKFLFLPKFRRHQRINHPSKFIEMLSDSVRSKAMTGQKAGEVFHVERSEDSGSTPVVVPEHSLPEVEVEVELVLGSGSGKNNTNAAPFKNSDEVIERITRSYPGNWRAKGRMELPYAHCEAVMRALIRDGQEVVERGTAAYASAVGLWPVSERRMIPDAAKWFDRSEYLKDPELWRRSDGQVSKSEQRAAGNAAAIREGFGYGKHAAAGGPDKRERPATGGVKVLAPGTSG